jgi:hypothetical protein
MGWTSRRERPHLIEPHFCVVLKNQGVCVVAACLEARLARVLGSGVPGLKAIN